MAKNKKKNAKSSSGYSYLILILIAILLFVGLIGYGGFIGSIISSFMFGLMGRVYYFFPFFLLFCSVFFLIRRRESNVKYYILFIIIFLLVSLFCELISMIGQEIINNPIESFEDGKLFKSGGGFIGGCISYALCQAIGKVGAFIINIFGFLVVFFFISGKSIFDFIPERSHNKKRVTRQKRVKKYDNYDEVEDFDNKDDDKKTNKTNHSVRESFAANSNPDKISRIDNQVSGIDFNPLNSNDDNLNDASDDLPIIKEISDIEDLPPIADLLPIEDIPTIEEISALDEKSENVDIQGGSSFLPVEEYKNNKVSEVNPFNEINEISEISLNPLPIPKYYEPKPIDEVDDTKNEELPTIELPSFDEDIETKDIELTPLNISNLDSNNTHEVESLNTNLDILKDENPTDNTILSEDDNSTEKENVLDDNPPEIINSFEEIATTDNDRTIEDENPTESVNTIEDENPTESVNTIEDVVEYPPIIENYTNDLNSVETDNISNNEFDRENDFENEEDYEKPYIYPSVDLLIKSTESKIDSDESLNEIANKLVNTLANFGVDVSLSDFSRGPAVTRYEIIPSTGTKVAKILNLQDDIKLNLAAADIRMEAPIPGKSAIGIEVPNKNVEMVRFRDLIDSDAFKNTKSPIAFGTGKDLSGDIIISDIAKMPHVLIAGATGSGKSVCINTIIMSILFKASPDEVNFIMIDPKVVELSIYNGIPHLITPVVSDPKKAAGALYAAVAEMNLRYRKFAELGTRDMAGYNKKVTSPDFDGDKSYHVHLPHIVVIVDELADLMMVAKSEVEENICRLAQLARAAGIHLIIATQRPSVDVITGLIKANMPSRIAFAVTSGVDSRTILDMNGAEKLLGKGDMLYFPQGNAKPIRVQGAFVSDDEVMAVAEFVKTENKHIKRSTELSKQIELQMSTQESVDSSNNNSVAVEEGKDEYFEAAGRLIIEMEKGSIGMLQRKLKVGFNRAARIMDQLADAGVVGPEEGTKPRKILVTMEEFDQLLNEDNL